MYPGLEFPLPRYYDWSDQSYRDFMMEILRCLNPRREECGYLLMDELEECLEIFFLMKGTVGVGFEINKIRHFGLKTYQDPVISLCQQNTTPIWDKNILSVERGKTV